MKGVFFSSKLPELCEIRDFDIPTPDDDEVLIRNVAVASNPKDWKVPLWMPEWAAIEGNDVAGYIHKVGSSVVDFKEGDRVAAFTKMRTANKYGAYAEYSVAPSHTTWHLADSTSFQDAATLPLAMMTAAIGLFVQLKLEPPSTLGTSSSKDGIVVINGAASSVGAFAVQLARRAGYHVIGIAGRSTAYPKELGADRVVDYREKSPEQLGKEVKQAVSDLQAGDIVGVYDAVSTEDTVKMLAENVLQAQGGGGNITTVLPVGKKLAISKVQVIQTMVGSAHDKDAEFAKKWYRQVGKWLDDGSFKPNQVKLMPNGLDSVKEGVHLLKDNKVNAQKLVYKISDSPCLSA